MYLCTSTNAIFSPRLNDASGWKCAGYLLDLSPKPSHNRIRRKIALAGYSSASGNEDGVAISKLIDDGDDDGAGDAGDGDDGGDDDEDDEGHCGSHCDFGDGDGDDDED